MRTHVDLKEKFPAFAFYFHSGSVDCGTEEDLGGHPVLFKE